MPNLPLVSVICLCYNHEKYVLKALESVLFQTYPNLEVWIVDDASNDKSVAVIEKFIREISQYGLKKTFDFQLICNEKNLGNCTSFNEAFKKAKGKYIVDLAADDVLMDERIEKQVHIFEKLSEKYGVVFSNALLINERGELLKYHYPVDESGKSKVFVPSGEVYTAILERYFICTPTMLIRKSVLDELGGYDEDLSYEDFNFWVRSSRNYLYEYQDEVTTLKRILKNAHTTGFYQSKNNLHLKSTLKICHIAFLLNKGEEENQALSKSLKYYIRQAFFTQNFALVFGFYQLLKKVTKKNNALWLRLILLLSKLKIKVFWLYKIYLKRRGTKHIGF